MHTFDSIRNTKNTCLGEMEYAIRAPEAWNKPNQFNFDFLLHLSPNDSLPLDAMWWIMSVALFYPTIQQGVEGHKVDYWKLACKSAK